MIGRVSTFSQTLFVLDRTLTTQARLAEVQVQTSSGLKSDSYGGYGSATRAIARYEADIARADADAATATGALNVVEQAYSALGSISDLTETILSSLATFGEDSATLAQGWLDDLESLLNSKYGDQALFAGDALAAQAVDLDAWDAANPGAWYNGGASARAYTTSDGQSLPLSVTADDPALSELVDTLKGLVAGTTTSAEALDSVRDAASGIGVHRASLSSSASRLERLAEQATARSDSTTTLVSTLKNADLAEAAILTTQYETLLQTSFSTLNILMSVKLSDFLR